MVTLGLMELFIGIGFIFNLIQLISSIVGTSSFDDRALFNCLIFAGAFGLTLRVQTMINGFADAMNSFMKAVGGTITKEEDKGED